MSAPPTASAATALREAFGDRKVPDITRKITACVLCRKLKVSPISWRLEVISTIDQYGVDQMSYE